MHYFYKIPGLQTPLLQSNGIGYIPCTGKFLRGDKEQLERSSMESVGWTPGNTMGGLKDALQSLRPRK